MSTRPAGLLELPPRHRPGKESFDSRPKHVEAWLEHLPLGDLGECARLLFNALQQVNHLNISQRERQGFLDNIQGPIDKVLLAIKKHYISQAMPLSPRNRKLAQLAITLNNEMAIGYKIIVEENWSHSLTLFNKKPTVYAMQQAMHYLSEMLLTAYQVYIHPPYNGWLHLYQIYWYAEEQQLDTTKVKGLHSKPAIAEQLKRIALLGMISPYRLRQVVIDNVYTNLAEWSELCNIRPATDINADAHNVLIRLNSDAAPVFYGKYETVSRESLRSLDTSALAQTLNGLLMQKGQPLNQHLSDDVIKLLLLSWTGKARRAFTRKTTDNSLSLTLGMTATYNLIRDLYQTQPIVDESGPCESVLRVVYGDNLAAARQSPGEEPPLDLASEFNDGQFATPSANKPQADVWDTNYGSKTAGYDYNLRLWLEQQERKQKDKDYTAVASTNLNESASGYCLIGRLEFSADAPKVQVGEIVGITDGIEEQSHIVAAGVVRRIENKDDGIELGIQKLAPCTEIAVVTRYRQVAGEQHYSRCLLLPELKPVDQPVTLLLSHRHAIDDQLIINKNGFKTHIKLTKLLENTGIFLHFEFSVVKHMGLDPDKENGTHSGREFENVWSLI